MRELPDHLSAGTVLNQQRVFPTYLGASGYVINLDQQRCLFDIDRRHVAIDDALFGVNLGRGQVHFVGVVVAGRSNARENLAHLRLVVDKL
jgi:hypothetical protein